jgi:hypothetical protein
MTQAKICIVIAYYGKWPVYLPVFLKGCEDNKAIIDVILITDIDDPNVSFPSNVKTVNYSLDQIAKRVETSFSIKTSNFRPYKMCDLKPAYGHLFPELIEGYDFWGFGDIDLIYGNLRRYFTDRILTKYEIMTFRDEWISGALTVLKNTEKINTLFMRSKDYLSIFSSPINHAFDECGKKHGILRTGVHPLDIDPDYSKNDVNCFTQVVSKAMEDGDIRVFQREYVKESLPFNEILWHIDGRLMTAGSGEVALFHAVWEKRFNRFVVPQWKTVPKNLFITSTGFYAFPNRLWKLTHYYRLVVGSLLDFSVRVKASLKYRLGLN